jgi:hypothetical protein
MKIVKAPEDWSVNPHPWLFSAGSIEMGEAELWQDRLFKLLEDTPGTFVNPRRDDWDSTWANSPTQGPMAEQVRWELEAREAADIVVFYFDPNTKSPITLLELGLSAESGSTLEQRVVVCCPPDFWRYANVALTCDYYSLPMVPDIDALAEWVKTTVLKHLHAS